MIKVQLINPSATEIIEAWRTISDFHISNTLANRMTQSIFDWGSGSLQLNDGGCRIEWKDVLGHSYVTIIKE